MAHFRRNWDYSRNSVSDTRSSVNITLRNAGYSLCCDGAVYLGFAKNKLDGTVPTELAMLGAKDDVGKLTNHLRSISLLLVVFGISPTLFSFISTGIEIVARENFLNGTLPSALLANQGLGTLYYFRTLSYMFSHEYSPPADRQRSLISPATKLRGLYRLKSAWRTHWVCSVVFRTFKSSKYRLIHDSSPVSLQLQKNAITGRLPTELGRLSMIGKAL